MSDTAKWTMISAVALVLSFCISILLGVAGEPQSCWLWGDVFGLIECGG